MFVDDTTVILSKELLSSVPDFLGTETVPRSSFGCVAALGSLSASDVLFTPEKGYGLKILFSICLSWSLFRCSFLVPVCNL